MHTGDKVQDAKKKKNPINNNHGGDRQAGTRRGNYGCKQTGRNTLAQPDGGEHMITDTHTHTNANM